MSTSTPDYLAYGDSGDCLIELSKPLALSSGADVAHLTMREPTVEDQIVHDELRGSDAVREVTMFANLCEVAPDDVRKLTLKNYRRLQEAYQGFLG